MKKEKSCGAVVYKIINNQIFFLIEKMQRGHFSIPKGHVENNETEIETALREIKEETNLEVESIGMFINTFDYLSKSGKKSRQFNFEVMVKETTNIFLTEHDEYSWLSLEEIEKNESITEEVKHTVQIFKYNNNLK